MLGYWGLIASRRRPPLPQAISAYRSIVEIEEERSR